MNQITMYRAGLYCRLSKDDDPRGESISISTQRSMLTAFCQERGFEIQDVFVDDGFSGLHFERPAFRRMLSEIEKGNINMVLTKDLSRLGRDYIMTGYYSEIFFPSQGVRYIALGDHYDSANSENDIAPFKNILNDMYAKDISRKIKSARRQQAKDGRFIGSQAPFGYQRNGPHLVIDPEAAEIVKTIYQLASNGLGAIAISKSLERQKVMTPSAYKCVQRDPKLDLDKIRDAFKWSTGTIQKILKDPVYLGDLVSLKTERTNYKTKQRAAVPFDQRVYTFDAHEAIISRAQFESVQKMRALHKCPATNHRENIFRGLLFCDCCGHPLSAAHRKLKEREDDVYRCMHHFYHPNECPQTHAIYHSILYPYLLNQVRAFAKSLRRRKVTSPLVEYADITELTPEILRSVINRIEIGHMSRKTTPSKAVRIFWKL